METQKCKESYFINSENIKLYRQIYNPINESLKALVFLSHGLFEHCEASYYEPIIKPMRLLGCLVVTHDHYGHGRSEGDRGMIYDFHVLVRDVVLDIKEVKRDLKLAESLPIFLYGHSMGGLISVLAILENKDFFKGVMLEGPALAHNINSFTVCIGRLISHVYPSCPIQALDYKELSRDYKFCENVSQDPLYIHSKVSAITGITLLNALNSIKDVSKDFHTSIIIGHGECDTLTLVSGSKMFIDNISSTDKTLIVYPKAKHQLRMEIENVNVEFSDAIMSWLKERLV